MGKRDRDLKRGPVSTKDVEKALRRDGWMPRTSSGKGHQVMMEHPTKPGKIPLSQKWTALRAWDPTLRGIAETSGLGKAGLLRLLNGRDPE